MRDTVFQLSLTSACHVLPSSRRGWWNRETEEGCRWECAGLNVGQMGAWTLRTRSRDGQFTRRSCPPNARFPCEDPTPHQHHHTITNNGGPAISILSEPVRQSDRRWRAGCDNAFAHHASAGGLHHGVHHRQRLHLQVRLRSAVGCIHSDHCAETRYERTCW